MIFSGNNNYSGGTMISAGTLQMGNVNALGSNSGTLGFNGGTLDLNGYSPTVAGLSANAGLILSTSAAAVTLTVNQSVNTVYGGNLANGSGTLGLTKSGIGSLTISTTNSYSGPTNISGGTLLLDATTVPNGERPCLIQRSTSARVQTSPSNGNDLLGSTAASAFSVSGMVTKLNNESEDLYRPIALSGGTLTSVGTFTGNGAWDLFGGTINTAANTGNYIGGESGFLAA